MAASARRCVRLVPSRALPRRGVEERRAQFPLAWLERAEAEVARARVALGGMMDGVHISIRVIAPRLEHRRVEFRSLEARQVRRRRVDRGRAVDERLGEHASDTRRVRDPHRLTHPEPAEVGMLTDQRVPVRCEREHPVEAPLQHGLAQGGHQLARQLPGFGEILRGEGVDDAVLAALVGVEAGGRHRQAPMVERPDADAVAMVAVVQPRIVVADDRHRGFVPRVGGERGHGCRDDVLVLERQHRQRESHHRGDGGPPHAGATHHHVGGDDLAAHANPGHATVAVLDAGDLGIPHEPGAPGDRATRLRLDRS